MATAAQFRTARDRMLAVEGAAEYLGVTPGTLSVWRSTGRYQIPFVKVGARVKYRIDDLDAWLESRTHHNGTTVAA